MMSEEGPPPKTEAGNTEGINSDGGGDGATLLKVHLESVKSEDLL